MKIREPIYQSENISEKISLLWQEFTDEKFSKAKRLDIESLLNDVQKECRTDIDEYLSVWMAIFDEGIQLLLQLYNFSSECYNRHNLEVSPAYVLLLGRICSLTVGIRNLLINGLEDCARLLTRTLIETIDVTIVSLDDPLFANSFFPKKVNFDDKKFWNGNIGYGKIVNKIQKVIEKTGIDNETISKYLDNRKKIKNLTSGSVHSNYLSALHSSMIPSLKYPGRFSTSVLGHVSTYVPSHILAIISEIDFLGTIVLKLLMSENPPNIFKDAENVEGLESIFVSILVYQELVLKYEDKLDIHFLDEYKQA